MRLVISGDHRFIDNEIIAIASLLLSGTGSPVVRLLNSRAQEIDIRLNREGSRSFLGMGEFRELIDENDLEY